MKRSAIYAIVAVIVIIIIIIAAVFALGLIPMGTTNPTPTPAPTTAPGIGNATTITFSANVTSQGTTTEYKWQAKNIHANNTVLRVDLANYAYILDAGQEKSWSSTDSGAKWTAGNFTADWISWSPQWSDFTANLAHWSGSGDYSYTNQAGEGIVLFNIVPDATIPDSTFTAT